MYCCERLKSWNQFGRNKELKKAEAPAPAPTETAAAAEPEPATKMQKVMVCGVEIMVENGATVTIAGVPITFN